MFLLLQATLGLPLPSLDTLHLQEGMHLHLQHQHLLQEEDIEESTNVMFLLF